MYPELDEIHYKILNAKVDSTYYPPARKFEFAIDWDLDSTPDWLKKFGRAIDIMRPQLEACMVLGSLGHDIRYYYGGSVAMKARADRIFRDTVVEYSIFSQGGKWSVPVADSAHVAVDWFGGAPFLFPYSWAFGRPLGERGYHEPASEQKQLIEDYVREASTIFLNGRYKLRSLQANRINAAIAEQLQALNLWVRAARWIP